MPGPGFSAILSLGAHTPPVGDGTARPASREVLVFVELHSSDYGERNGQFRCARNSAYTSRLGNSWSPDKLESGTRPTWEHGRLHGPDAPGWNPTRAGGHRRN